MASKNDLIKLHMDTMGFASKPGSGEKGNRIPAIISRTSRNIVSITKEELVERVLGGYSYVPGVCPMSEDRKKQMGAGALQADWEEQQIFALDFDCGTTMTSVLERLEKQGVKPFFAYDTFSSTEEKEKFRVVFATSEVVADRNLRDRLQATLMGLFKGEVDRSCANRNRYFNGTRPDARTYIDYDAVIDAENIVSSYWDEDFACYLPKDGAKSTSKKSKLLVDKSTCTKKTYEIEVNKKIVPFSRGCFRANAPANIEALNKVFALRDWVEGDHREKYLFIYYNVVKIRYGAEIALEMVREKNEQMAEPLCERELYYAITHTENHIETNMPEFHGDGVFPFNRETMANENWLNLTDEEVRQSGFLATKQKNDQAEENKPVREAMKAEVIALHKAGLHTAEIKRALEEKFGFSKSKRTIQNYVRCENFPQTIIFYYYSLQAISPALRRLVEQQNEKDVTPTLNLEQQLALDDAMNGQNIIVSGNAGTGKSYLVEKMVEALRKSGRVVAVTAATGVAANNIGGHTTHSVFHIYNKEEMDLDNLTIPKDFVYEIAEYDTIAIDEVSMLGYKEFAYIYKVLKEVEEVVHKKIQIILIGDFMQLSPVNDAYCFKNNMFFGMNFNFHYLTQVVRQQDDVEYITHLNNVRVGYGKTYTSCGLNRICSRGEDIRYTYIVPYRMEAYRINREHLNSIEGDLIDLGNEQFVKVGAKVIVTENYSRNGITKYFNGMQGVVVSVSENKQVLTIRTTDERIVKIHRKMVQLHKDADWVQGFPIDLGYAITTHKSQGMTLEGANINPCVFAEGQLYVALSRVKSASGVYLLKPIRPEYIKVNIDALAFDEMMHMESERRMQVAM